MKLRISRKRCEFGAPVKFGDQNTAAMREPIINCEPYEDESCSLKKYELDVGIQVFVLILTRSWLLLILYAELLRGVPGGGRQVAPGPTEPLGGPDCMYMYMLRRCYTRQFFLATCDTNLSEKILLCRYWFLWNKFINETRRLIF